MMCTFTDIRLSVKLAYLHHGSPPTYCAKALWQASHEHYLLSSDSHHLSPQAPSCGKAELCTGAKAEEAGAIGTEVVGVVGERPAPAEEGRPAPAGGSTAEGSGAGLPLPKATQAESGPIDIAAAMFAVAATSEGTEARAPAIEALQDKSDILAAAAAVAVVKGGGAGVPPATTVHADSGPIDMAAAATTTVEMTRTGAQAVQEESSPLDTASAPAGEMGAGLVPATVAAAAAADCVALLFGLAAHSMVAVAAGAAAPASQIAPGDGALPSIRAPPPLAAGAGAAHLEPATAAPVPDRVVAAPLRPALRKTPGDAGLTSAQRPESALLKAEGGLTGRKEASCKEGLAGPEKGLRKDFPPQIPVALPSSTSGSAARAAAAAAAAAAVADLTDRDAK